jgi:hypothetical protein
LVADLALQAEEKKKNARRRFPTPSHAASAFA